MRMIEAIRTTTAALILLAFVGAWLAMEWVGRQPDSVILLGAIAVALGAGYYLWDDAMGEGVDAVEDLQGDDTDE
jgi:threonine/homoserine efflux transporter RhtA